MIIMVSCELSISLLLLSVMQVLSLQKMEEDLDSAEGMFFLMNWQFDIEATKEITVNHIACFDIKFQLKN